MSTAALSLPYCGSAPVPGQLLERFNLDPRLILALALLALIHIGWLCSRQARGTAIAGWLTAAAALISPVCALSVSLFSARIGQHMVLILIAAPLIALASVRKSTSTSSTSLWSAAGVFFVALWFWHMPRPYDATFTSTAIYWCMHITLFGSALWLWRALLHHGTRQTMQALAVGIFSSMQMGMLGAMLTLATHPLFFPHLITSALWGLTPLQDQQLGGTLMWVPSILLTVWAAMRSLGRLWPTPQKAHGL